VVELTDEIVRAAGRHLAGRVGLVEPVSYDVASPTTGALFRLRGAGWSRFVKVVQSFRHWPLLEVFPPELRERALHGSTWRYEADLYGSGLADVLPPGLRLPEVHGIEELANDRVAIVLEDVHTDDSPWSRRRFARAARLLGQLNVRMTVADGLPAIEWREPGERTRLFYRSRVLPVALPALRDDATWASPLLAGASDLRADLDELAARLPAILDTVGALPQLVTHGDACPHNLLVPADRSAAFVVIDWAMGGVAAVGDELGQLLVGPAHEGRLSASELPALHDALVAAYVRGLADEGLIVGADVVRYGMDAGLAVRSAFTALPLERLGEPVTDELAAFVAQRLELTRYLVELGLAVHPSVGVRDLRPLALG
jgi:hypothetical protein